MTSQNPERYNMMDFTFEGAHITRDFKMAKPHMLVRAKSWYIFQQQIISRYEHNPSPRPNLPKYHYELNYHNEGVTKSIQFEEFDYSIIRTNLGDFQDSLVNGIFPLFRMLWRTRGGYDIKIKFNTDIDGSEFGEVLLTDFTADYKFSITSLIVTGKHSINQTILKIT